MTLFIDVAKEFLIKHIQTIIQESKNADGRSTTYGAFLGKRDLELSANKRADLTRLLTSIETMPTETDELNLTALLACIQTAETSLHTTRSLGKHAPANTEESLLRLKAFIQEFYTQLEKLKLLDDGCPTVPDPVFYLYHAIASYFAVRLSEGAVKTNILSMTTHWLSNHPSITYKRAFLMAIDDVIELKLQRFQTHLSGQKTKATNFEQIKHEAVDDCLEHLSLKHEALRHDSQYLNSLGQPVAMTFLLSYLGEAKDAIRLGIINLSDQDKISDNHLTML
ncbi:MAG: hypothetical protein P1U36_04340 [Legionellaceae bacterium]|nr:hypothetical protein [Legionellaceae bacterium]